MIFNYNSARYNVVKILPQNIVDELREYLKPRLRHDTRMGELHDLLINFKTSEGQGLLINQLEPIFTYCARKGEIWNK
jgi:hypothetical protein